MKVLQWSVLSILLGMLAAGALRALRNENRKRLDEMRRRNWREYQ